MSIYVAKRKNDQYREGHTSYLARSGKSTCPVTITEKILKVLPQSSPSSCPLVRRIIKSKSREYFHASIGVCSSTLREEFKKFIEPFVDRDLKIRRRRRQRERHKTIGLISKNNSSARALYVFVHFFAVLCKTTT